MYNPVFRIFLKIFELIGCIACLITKQLTDQEARRIALRNQKFSREWSLLNNVTWSREGNAFANVTYGGYTLITALLLISRCINSKSRPSLTDKIFLTVGVIFFFILGSLVYASIEQVPSDLFDNAIILGTLSFLVGLLFLIDLGDPSKRIISNQTQTETASNLTSSTQTSQEDEVSHVKKLNIPNFRYDVSPTPPSPKNQQNVIPPNGYYFSGDRVDVVQAKILPSVEQPVFSKILMPEKKRAEKRTVGNVNTSKFNKDINSDVMYVDDMYRVDTRNSNRYSNCSRKYCTYTSEEDNFDKPIKHGFVAQAARKWDRRAKQDTKSHEWSTIV